MVGRDDDLVKAILEEREGRKRAIARVATTTGGLSWRADTKVLRRDGRSESAGAAGLRGGK